MALATTFSSEMSRLRDVCAPALIVSLAFPRTTLRRSASMAFCAMATCKAMRRQDDRHGFWIPSLAARCITRSAPATRGCWSPEQAVAAGAEGACSRRLLVQQDTGMGERR